LTKCIEHNKKLKWYDQTFNFSDNLSFFQANCELKKTRLEEKQLEEENQRKAK
jgi:hypothetical protein